MRWIIIGADKATGAERRVAVDAATAGDAEAIARSHGLLVNTVRPGMERVPVLATEPAEVPAEQAKRTRYLVASLLGLALLLIGGAAAIFLRARPAANTTASPTVNPSQPAPKAVAVASRPSTVPGGGRTAPATVAVARSVPSTRPMPTAPTPPARSTPPPAAPTRVSVTRASGGTVRTPLFDTTLNPGSTLEREWITIHSSAMPAELIGDVGVTTSHWASMHGYKAQANYKLRVKEPVEVVEVRFLTFDFWGEPLFNDAYTEIKSFGVGEHGVQDDHMWSEFVVTHYYASIAYIARVRTRSGKVVEADTDVVLDEARKIWSKFAPEHLEPDRQDLRERRDSARNAGTVGA